jgi:hypothetical protein
MIGDICHLQFALSVVSQGILMMGHVISAMAMVWFIHMIRRVPTVEGRDVCCVGIRDR